MSAWSDCPTHGHCPDCSARMCEECGFDAEPTDTPAGFKCRDCAAADQLEDE